MPSLPDRPDSTLISAVIPTRNRPDLVERAVQSALSQTYSALEILVVVDGPDAETVRGLSQIPDPRLRVIELPQSRGGGGARNAGVAAARGSWIAFLDDDDEWLPTKLEAQLAKALQSRFVMPVISSRIVARTPLGDYIWPRRLPAPDEPISEYLFSRRGLFQGEGLMATPTLFAKRELLLAVPFRGDLKKHQDWDWIVRVSNRPGVTMEFTSEPLAICHMDQSRIGISNSDDWKYSLRWIRDVRTFVTPEAYAAFILIVVAAQAAGATNFREYLSLLSEALHTGSCRTLHVLLFAGMRLIPRDRRRQLRSWLGRSR